MPRSAKIQKYNSKNNKRLKALKRTLKKSMQKRLRNRTKKANHTNLKGGTVSVNQIHPSPFNSYTLNKIIEPEINKLKNDTNYTNKLKYNMNELDKLTNKYKTQYITHYLYDYIIPINKSNNNDNMPKLFYHGLGKNITQITANIHGTHYYFVVVNSIENPHVIRLIKIIGIVENKGVNETKKHKKSFWSRFRRTKKN